MRLNLAIVTNQGVPVHSVVIPSKTFQEKIIETLRIQWGLTDQIRIPVLITPITHGAYSTTAEDVKVKVVVAWTDGKKTQKYLLTVVSAEIPNTVNVEQPKEWKFCPLCGDSWLSHLEGQASLEVEDWTPQPCSECGCRKAVDP